MTDQPAAIDDALEQVITAARNHLTAVKAAGGAVEDEQVWRSYVALNNASYAYDQLLLDEYGEVTPWDTEAIDVEGKPKLLTQPGVAIGEHAKDPYPALLSVRQRRDYRVPSVAALIAAAQESAERLAASGEPVSAPETVADAVLELVRDGDGSLAGLDVPELEPLAGAVTVVEVSSPLAGTADPAAVFAVGAGDRVLGRYDEPPYLDDDEDAEYEDEEADGQ
jgi:hypothetical protein